MRIRLDQSGLDSAHSAVHKTMQQGFRELAADVGMTFHNWVRNPIRALLGESDAQSLVEFALVLPMVMILITGMASFGLLLNNYIMLAHATDVGARYIAMNNGNFSTGASNPCAMAAAQIQNAAGTLAASNLSYSITFTSPTGTTYTGFTSTNGSGSFGASSTCGTSGSTEEASGGIVTVSVQYPAALFVYGWTPGNINLVNTTTELIQ